MEERNRSVPILGMFSDGGGEAAVDLQNRCLNSTNEIFHESGSFRRPSLDAPVVAACGKGETPEANQARRYPPGCAPPHRGPRSRLQEKSGWRNGRRKRRKPGLSSDCR